MEYKQIARKIIKELKAEGAVKIGSGELLIYGWRLKKELQSEGYEALDINNHTIELYDNTIYWWGDFIEDVDWSYWLENKDITSKQSIEYLAKMVRDHEWNCLEVIKWH